MPDQKRIREWAKSAGYPVAQVGRVSLQVIAAYEAAHEEGGA